MSDRLDRLGRLGSPLVLLAVGAAVVDAVMTFVALRVTHSIELNPIADHAMQTLGLGTALLAGLAARIALVAILAWIIAGTRWSIARVAALTVIAAISAWWTFVVLHNLHTLQALRRS